MGAIDLRSEYVCGFGSDVPVMADVVEPESGLHLSRERGPAGYLRHAVEFSWADQPTHDPDGYLYTYYVVEINPPANFTPDDVNDLVVTNTYGSPTNTVEATKVWAPST